MPAFFLQFHAFGRRPSAIMLESCTRRAHTAVAIGLGSQSHRPSRIRTTSLRLLLLGSSIVACSSGQNHGWNNIEPPLPPPIAAADGGQANGPSTFDEFAAAVNELQGIVNLLSHTPPLSEGDGLRRAFDRLAAAIESIPGPPQPARSEAARLMRSRDFDIWVSLTREDATAGALRESLVIATGALALAAEGPYAIAAVKEGVARLKAAVERLFANEPLRAQRPQLLAALRGAVDALTAIRAAGPTVVKRESRDD